MKRDIVVAILAKNKEKYLPFYLKCIEEQTIDPLKIHIYIRTNNNTDNTLDILKNWVIKNKTKYKSIDFNDKNVSEQVEKFGEHEWNPLRFKVLSKIRQKSIDYAIFKNADYFVVDCDNFIKSYTLEAMIKSEKTVIAPLLVSESLYSNYHHCVDQNGYFENCIHYLPILGRDTKDIHLSDVIHCTYFIKHEVLKYITYRDETEYHEYIIFSKNLRNLNIPQYIDNRRIYGYLLLENANEDLNSVKRIEESMNIVKINSNTKIYYGVENNYIDITNICYEKLYDNSTILIPSKDINRAKYFGDHIPNVLKHIKIGDSLYNDFQEVEILIL